MVAEGKVYQRDNRLQLLGSPNDTPVIATQNRKLDNQGLSASASKDFAGNEIKVGVHAKRFPIVEHFSFLITDPTLNDPTQPGYTPTLAPYDGTRGGSPFVFDGSRTGRYLAGYAQAGVHRQVVPVHRVLRV